MASRFQKVRKASKPVCGWARCGASRRVASLSMWKKVKLRAATYIVTLAHALPEQRLVGNSHGCLRPLGSLNAGSGDNQQARLARPASLSWLVHYIVRLFLRKGQLPLAQRGVYWALCALSEQLQLRGEALASGEAAVPSAGASGAAPLAQVFYTEAEQLTPLALCYETQVQPWWSQISLYFWLWSLAPLQQAEGVHRLISTEPSFFVAWVGAALRLTYRIRYHALDRKVRKIVKNKYRFVRSYVCLREWQRVRLGLRLVPLAASLHIDQAWEKRLSAVLEALIWLPEDSLLRQLRRQHQQIALSALGLS